MDEPLSRMRWPQFVADLAGVTSKTTLAGRVGVTPREVARWIAGEAKPHGQQARLLLQEAEDTGLVNWRKYAGLAPAYDFRYGYEDNVCHGPQGLPKPPKNLIPSVPSHFFEFKVNSPLGIPASVLTMNSRWIISWAHLGFDIITYKSVRTRAARSHTFPNCAYLPELTAPLAPETRTGEVRAEFHIDYDDVSKISLANSVGIPSDDPKQWQPDIAKALKALGSGQVLIVSVLGSSVGASSDLESDFIRCAEMAHELSPHAIELNLSSPNSYPTEERLIYRDAELSARIIKKVREALPSARLLAKVGYMVTENEAATFFKATHKDIDGFTAINTVPLKVVSTAQQDFQIFTGNNRSRPGISGIAIQGYALSTIAKFAKLLPQKPELVLLGVGGVSCSQDVKRFREAGAHHVQMCTAAMFNPLLAAEIRTQLASQGYRATHSRILASSGAAVPFRDPATAAAFDLVVEVCEELGVPFETGYAALQKHWQNEYMRQHNSGPSMLKARGAPPTREQIERWVRDESSKR
jgi:dihydroorotate dehydrogenase